jgi:hypothetical protein
MPLRAKVINPAFAGSKAQVSELFMHRIGEVMLMGADVYSNACGSH